MGEQSFGGKPRLESWKAIANYLNVTVRTAQKWEKERGLPVQRQGSRSTVIASAEDLERWRCTGGPIQPTRTFLGRMVVIAPALLTLLSIVAVLAFFAWPSPDPARCEWRDGEFRVLDSSSKVLWTVPATEAAADHFDYGARDQSLVADLDGDGHPEVLANFRANTANASLSRVACYEPDGGLLWQFRPGAQVTLDGSGVSRDYLVFCMGLARDQRGCRLILAANHRTYRLAQIALVDPADGKLLAEHWHPGWVTAVLQTDLDRDSTAEMLVAGHQSVLGVDSPVMFRLDLDGLVSSDHRAVRPKPWEERGYWLFPRPDVCALLPHSTPTIAKLRNIDGTVEVEVVVQGAGNLHYRFDRSFNVIDCHPSDVMYHYHDWAFRLKTVDHPLDQVEVASWAKVNWSLRRPARPNTVRLGSTDD